MTTTIIPPAHLERIYHLLTVTYGEPEWIPDNDALGGLVGTILSQHTSNINSERAYHRAFQFSLNGSAVATPHSAQSEGSGVARACGLRPHARATPLPSQKLGGV